MEIVTGVTLDSNVTTKEKPATVNWSYVNKIKNDALSSFRFEISKHSKAKDRKAAGYIASIETLIDNINSRVFKTSGKVTSDSDEYIDYIEAVSFIECKKQEFGKLLSTYTVINMTGENNEK